MLGLLKWKAKLGEFPTATPELEPKELGDRFSQYVRVEAPLWRWFEMPDGKRPCFRGADLSGKNLREIRVDGADLREANLVEADLVNSHFTQVSFVGADLRRTNMVSATFFGCFFTGANLEGAVLMGAKLIECHLEGVDLTDAKVEHMSVDHGTCHWSYWGPSELKTLHARGVLFDGFNRFDLENVRGVLESSRGLHLYFNARLTPFDRFLVDNVIFAVLGQDTDCRVESFDQAEGRAVVRLVAEHPEDLFKVAEVLSQRVWEQAPGQRVVNLGAIEQQINAGNIHVGDDTGRLADEMRAQRQSYEAQLQAKDEQIVVLQGRLAESVSNLVDRIERMTWCPGPGDGGEERTWPVTRDVDGR